MANDNNDGSADYHANGAGGRRDRVAVLLQLAAADDAAGFKAALDAAGSDAEALVNEVDLWRGRQSNAFEARTPLMVAAACGSAAVVALLLGLGVIDVNRRPGVDGATALHCAASGGAANAAAVVTALLAAGADPAVPDAAGRVPADVILQSQPASRAGLVALLSHSSGPVKKEYPVDPTLPDMSSAVYASDEFRMFKFKIQPCARAYAHDWTECPFLHPGENARRRDPRTHAYTAVPCPSSRLPGGCPRGDACDFSHGVFESWLHPSQYRTRMCRDGDSCVRRTCFFAHDQFELRHVPRDASGAGVLSPRAAAGYDDVAVLGLLLPAGSPTTGAHWVQQGATASRLRNPLNARLFDDAQVDELGTLLQLASLNRSQPRLPSIQQPPACYMAAPLSSFGNDRVYSPSVEEEAAQTALLLARIRWQQGVRVPPVSQRDMFERRSLSPTTTTTIKRQQPIGSLPIPARGSHSSRLNIVCPSSKIDWSVGANDLLWSP